VLTPLLHKCTSTKVISHCLHDCTISALRAMSCSSLFLHCSDTSASRPCHVSCCAIHVAFSSGLQTVRTDCNCLIRIISASSGEKCSAVRHCKHHLLHTKQSQCSQCALLASTLLAITQWDNSNSMAVQVCKFAHCEAEQHASEPCVQLQRCACGMCSALPHVAVVRSEVRGDK
jgi:hypothetical protein